jgi:hypothetical protein
LYANTVDALRESSYTTQIEFPQGQRPLNEPAV